LSVVFPRNRKALQSARQPRVFGNAPCPHAQLFLLPAALSLTHKCSASPVDIPKAFIVASLLKGLYAGFPLSFK
jgi:hypothetical protein